MMVEQEYREQLSKEKHAEIEKKYGRAKLKKIDIDTTVKPDVLEKEVKKDFKEPLEAAPEAIKKAEALARKEAGLKLEGSSKKATPQPEKFDLYNNQTKEYDAYSKMVEAQSRAEQVTFNSLAQKYNFAKGQVSKMPVSTEALKQKMGTPPEMQEAPEFDPETGRVLAQLATSILAGLGPSHASVKSGMAVGMDVTAKTTAQSIAQQEAAVQAVAKRNDKLMIKYQDDIDGLFREYDKAENQSLRDYAKNYLQMEEMNFRKEAKALDIEAKNADRKLRANIAGKNAAMRERQFAMQNAQFKAKLKQGADDGVFRLVTGGEKMNQRSMARMKIYSPELFQVRNNSLNKFLSAPPNVSRRNWNIAPGVAKNIYRIIDKEEDPLTRQRLGEYSLMLLDKGVIINPTVLRELASSPATYDISSLETAYRQRIAVPAGFNQAVLGGAMEISAQPTEGEILVAKNLAQGVRFALSELYEGKAGQANFVEGSILPFGWGNVKKEKVWGQ